MKTPERTTAEAFPWYVGGVVLANSATLKWPGLFVRRYRFPRVVDGFVVPATAEPLIACIIAGSAEFQEREIGGAWLPPACGVETCSSPGRRSLTNCAGTRLWEQNQFTAALETVYQDKAVAVEVSEFFGRDETLAHLSLACAELLSAGTAGNAKRITAFTHLLAIYIAEKYTNVAVQRPGYRGGLPIARLRKIEDYVRAHLAESI
jgi:hypothetical protein